ncbi:TPA: hypothetical protein ACGO3I_001620 [Streptococcus suis]|uniref:hypothetical protein n=1 Tax=Streptococcus orisratti TaxID=114652 RepID=UPI0015531629|nr:hypothetical protein [Streptococcus orisratti]MCQ8268518.1 hypothetical protein [Streptococcus suis]BCP58271.1 hypothetical protein SUT007_17290 [Streptococcus parasuis]MDY5635434.1 hypothetical protein [Streptococcus orisratti]NQI73497.1 hypothetical protein [Streptococcus suis]NQM12619.1 hypothetical protein [Streptococcus suis]
MAKENPLKDSISRRMDEERHQIPKEKKENKKFDFQLILIISILIGLLLTILRLVTYF